MSSDEAETGVTGQRVLRRPEANQDIIEHAFYIAARGSLDASDRFLQATEQAFGQLAAMPKMGRRRGFRRSYLSDVRQWAVPGFPNHLVFYRPVDKGIEVLRVLHGARDIEAVFEESPEPEDDAH